MEEEARRLMLATGKIVSNYKPLIKYLELANPEQREKALPRSSDIEVVRSLLEKGYGTLEEVLNEVAKIVRDRLDPELSQKAIKYSLDVELGRDEAVRYISKLLAGWIIEIAEQLGVVRLRTKW